MFFLSDRRESIIKNYKKIDLHLMTNQRNLIFKIINKQKINKGDVSKFFTWEERKNNQKL